MNFLALDLEMNQPSKKIIEIGVVVGNVGDGIIFEQSWIIDPLEPISEYITALTGIDDRLIKDSCVPLKQARDEIADAQSRYGCYPNAVQWGKGDTDLLAKTLESSGIEPLRFGRRDLDVKTICVFQAISVGKKPKGGLSKYVAAHGLTFDGVPHRAAFDARATLNLFFELIRRERLRDNS